MSAESQEYVVTNFQLHDIYLEKFKHGIRQYITFYRKYGNNENNNIKEIRNKMKLTIESFRREAVRINAWHPFWNQYVLQAKGKVRLNEIESLDFTISSLKRLVRN